MLTLNADAHALMSRMHKPDPKLGPDQQDKRSVIRIEAGDFDQWLEGTVDQAQALLRLAPVEIFDAGPAPIDKPEGGAAVTLILEVKGANAKQLANGVATAQAVFDAASVTPYEGLLGR